MRSQRLTRLRDSVVKETTVGLRLSSGLAGPSKDLVDGRQTQTRLYRQQPGLVVFPGCGTGVYVTGLQLANNEEKKNTHYHRMLFFYEHTILKTYRCIMYWCTCIYGNPRTLNVY